MTRYLRAALSCVASISAIAAAAAITVAPAPAEAAAGVTADVTSGIVGSYTGANNIASVVPTVAQNIFGLVRLTPGTGNGQADKEFIDYRTIAASGTDSIDLAGALTDPLGASLTFAKVKVIAVFADAANTNDVVISPGATNPFNGPFGGTSPTINVRPGGFTVFALPNAGWTVTASTGDLLKIANSGSGTSVSYRIVVIGTSA